MSCGHVAIRVPRESLLPPSKEQRKWPLPNRILFRDFLELFQGNDVILLAIHVIERPQIVIRELRNKKLRAAVGTVSFFADIVIRLFLNGANHRGRRFDIIHIVSALFTKGFLRIH